MLSVYLTMLDTPEQESKFEHIYSAYANYLYNTAFSVTHDSALAEDAVQDTFLQIIREIDLLRSENEKQLKSYLYLLARNRAVDLMRKRGKDIPHIQLLDEASSEVSEGNVEELAISRLQLDKAIRTLNKMPDIYQRALYLSVCGYTIREISEITQSTESAVKSRIHRARRIILTVFSAE